MTPQQTPTDRTLTVPKPTPRTPAGAFLEINRGRRWTRVQVDRISITDATVAQADVASRLSRAAAFYVVALGKRGAVYTAVAGLFGM